MWKEEKFTTDDGKTEYILVYYVKEDDYEITNVSIEKHEYEDKTKQKYKHTYIKIYRVNNSICIDNFTITHTHNTTTHTPKIRTCIKDYEGLEPRILDYEEIESIFKLEHLLYYIEDLKVYIEQVGERIIEDMIPTKQQNQPPEQI